MVWREWGAWGAWALLAVALVGGVVTAYAQAPATRADYIASQTLARDLERLGVRHMYTDYWTCDKTAFLTQERITCDTLGDTLHQGDNRYPPYAAATQADPRAAYVFPDGSPQAKALAVRAADPAWRYTLSRLDGYVVYLPKT